MKPCDTVVKLNEGPPKSISTTPQEERDRRSKMEIIQRQIDINISS